MEKANNMFITTPVVVLVDNGIVRSSWEEKTPDLDAVLRNIVMLNETLTLKSRV